MKKDYRVFIVAACIGLGVLLAYQTFWLALYSVFTKTTVFSQVVSPDGKTKASVFQVDSGATSGFNRQVVLTPNHTLFANEALYDRNNKVMYLNGEANVHLSWRGAKNLVVDYRDNPNPDIDYQKNSWYGVSLTYLGARKWKISPTSTTVIINTLPK